MESAQPIYGTFFSSFSYVQSPARGEGKTLTAIITVKFGKIIHRQQLPITANAKANYPGTSNTLIHTAQTARF
jgi:hypothetical protein